MARFIYIKGKRLYFYDTFNTFTEARKIAKYYQKKLKNNYFIIPYETFATGQIRYKLYMNKVFTLV